MVTVINEEGVLTPLISGLGQAAQVALKQKLQERLLNQQQQQQKSQNQASLQFLQSIGQLPPNVDVSQFSQLSPQAISQFVPLIQKQREKESDEQKQQLESQLLARVARGEPLSLEEQSQLSPTSQRAILQAQKPVFETEAQKIEAKRVADIANDITKEASAVKTENARLDRMESLSEEGKLSTPLMVKTLNTMGLPLSVLGNPNTEEFNKLENDFVRDVSDIFRGAIRVFEIQAYLKTVPSLLNSVEGRRAIIRNRKILNEMKLIRFNAMKDIIKENNGQRPPNLDLLIDERTSEQQAELAERFRNGITENIQEFQPSMRMLDDQGGAFDIPMHLIPRAVEQGLKFQ